jgi:hypothetical protein
VVYYVLSESSKYSELVFGLFLVLRTIKNTITTTAMATITFEVRMNQRGREKANSKTGDTNPNIEPVSLTINTKISVSIITLLS